MDSIEPAKHIDKAARHIRAGKAHLVKRAPQGIHHRIDRCQRADKPAQRLERSLAFFLERLEFLVYVADRFRHHRAGFREQRREAGQIAVAGDFGHDFIERPDDRIRKDIAEPIHFLGNCLLDFLVALALGRDLELKTCLVDVGAGKAKDIAEADHALRNAVDRRQQRLGGFICGRLIGRADLFAQPPKPFGFDHLERLDQPIEPLDRYAQTRVELLCFLLKEAEHGRHGRHRQRDCADRSAQSANGRGCRAELRRDHAAKAAEAAGCKPAERHVETRAEATRQSAEPACNPAEQPAATGTATETAKAAQDPARARHAGNAWHACNRCTTHSSGRDPQAEHDLVFRGQRYHLADHALEPVEDRLCKALEPL